RCVRHAATPGFDRRRHRLTRAARWRQPIGSVRPNSVPKPEAPRGRGLRMGALSATVAASYLGGAVRRLFLPSDEREAHRAETHRKNAQRILDVAGQLKGGVMKAMQLLSYQAEVLPEEYLDILSGLQDQAPPMSAAQARAVIEAELGAPPERLFAHFDP